ncbi:beta-ketoacyl-[acyl-carrier-protein] synthase family protein [Gloeobacter morelensis]|uniref:Beta-ketoacyl-[acyl-carrier-protein] synthase family protein n=1 Tax=Gloeobacter morelensis MG652769 TaxID=2781736 RepID=A0ABY3PLJ9_9CYAN|nr:beta-ketoacyl-[acyl-carrier-protein] synthase family protein [Gloeobacter morelensis]UFP94558.1 beta-ketoacyl-[acyl-carrier-protein] synthase family protein [Gloeobacter morelensis MG652769]
MLALERSVVITGLGIVSCLGGEARTTWKRLLAGERGYEPGEPVGRAGTVQAETGRVVALVQQAAREALADAGSREAFDFGVAIGSSRGLQADWENGRTGPLIGLDAPVHAVAALAGTQGPLAALSCACASGAWAIGTGYRWIRWGLCDRVLVGAADAAITPLNLAGFRRAGALARDACLPFDRCHSGFVLAEGAAVLVLEAEEVAHGRPYTRIRGFSATCDAFHPTAPHPEGEGLARAIERCRKQAPGLSVGAVHAHGTGTAAGDPVEAAVIARLYAPGTPVIACKGSLGHSLGASSAIEAALACLALQTGQLPPIAGLTDPIAPLAFVREAFRTSMTTLMLHSLGFGGQNTALLLEACPSPRRTLG